MSWKQKVLQRYIAEAGFPAGYRAPSNDQACDAIIAHVRDRFAHIGTTYRQHIYAELDTLLTRGKRGMLDPMWVAIFAVLREDPQFYTYLEKEVAPLPIADDGMAVILGITQQQLQDLFREHPDFYRETRNGWTVELITRARQLLAQ